MSEIVLRMDPKTGAIEKVQLIADDEKSQLDGIKRLQLYIRDINQLSKKTSESARHFNLFNSDDINGK